MNLDASASTSNRIDLALAVLRIVVGIVFLVHGAQKLFDFGLGGTVEAFAGMGVPLASITGPAVAFVEFLGGADGFFAPMGFEFPLTVLAAATALVLAGPGAYSVDARRAG